MFVGVLRNDVLSLLSLHTPRDLARSLEGSHHLAFVLLINMDIVNASSPCNISRPVPIVVLSFTFVDRPDMDRSMVNVDTILR